MTLFHEVHGQGPALVLLHGWAMHSGIFAPLVDRLAPHFTLHCVDLPGHGRSAGAGLPLTLENAAAQVSAVVPARRMALAVAPSPVNAILSTSGWVTRRSPAPPWP